MSKPIVNLADIELKPRPAAFAPTGAAAGRFDARMGFIGSVLGTQKLGCNLTAVPPGKRAFPFHNHRMNDELFFVVAGEGEIRIGDSTYAIKPGDIIACPAGPPETAHQIINTGTAELRYLAISSKLSPDVTQYPDSGKFAIWAQYDDKPETFRFVGRESQSIDYWEGE